MHVDLEVQHAKNDIRYKTKNIPLDFVSIEISKIALVNIISQRESTMGTQEDIGTINVVSSFTVCKLK